MVKKTISKKNFVQSVGRRKTAVARATCYNGSGIIYINNEPLNDYLKNKYLVLKSIEPLLITDLEKKYDFKINVFGGGQNSQTGAIRQAIARAIVNITKSDKIKKQFQEYDKTLLIADTRFKEMYKPNSSKARAKRQKSYR